MTEVLRRRFTASEDGEVRWPRPDLLVIDGGIGQLTAALEGLRATKTAIPAIGLAKAKGDKEERIFVPNRKGALILPAGSPATHLLQRIRDEAHRFAVSYHRKLRGKALVASVLEEIPGIGDARKKRLLTHFVRLEDIARATDEQFKEAGIDAKTAGEIRKGLLSFT